jgi:Delta7-sterol 5-desaturase
MEAEFIEIATHFAGAAGRSLVRYGIICGGAFAVFWVLLADRLEHRRIQPDAPPRRMNWLEARDSIYSTLVIAVVTAVSLYLYERGHLQIYMDPTELGLPWLGFTFLLLVFGFDTYFYWTHRLIHHASVYGFVHKKHHEFTDPSPLAAYSFTAIEALVYALFAPLLLLVLPVNFWVLMVAGSWFGFASMMVHLGYEMAPSWWGRSVFTRWIGTSTMHNMHHEHVHYNFALYFTFWDRAMGTMHPDYDETLAELTAQPLLHRAQPAGA